MSDVVTQKEFYEAIQKVTKETNDLTIAMTETKTLIRDYNGLRKKINDTDDRLQRLEDAQTYKNNNRSYIGWVIGCIGGIMGILGTAIALYTQIQ